MERAVILIECPDQKGIVARVSDFIFQHDANIIQSDQYSTDPENGVFFMRLEFCFDPKRLSRNILEKEFASLATKLRAHWNLHYHSTRLRIGILLSKEAKGGGERRERKEAGEGNADITCVISNHPDHRIVVEQAGVPYHYIPVSAKTKSKSEKDILALVQKNTDVLVLARYMQILSPKFLKAYQHDIINIHHSFLPSFKGANPYKQAHERGVKVIGATAHYVTENLDEGPIIEQVVERMTHRDDLDDLRRKSRHLEKVALANAIQAHVEHRVIRYKNKTIVFA